MSLENVSELEPACVVVRAWNPRPGRLRQEDCLEFKASLSYKMIPCFDFFKKDASQFAPSAG